MTIAFLTLPPAFSRTVTASSLETPVASIRMFCALTTSFSLVWTTSTMRFLYAFPVLTMLAVEIMFSIIFCAVPALSRVEPVSTSEPTMASIATEACFPIMESLLQAIETVLHPNSAA